MLEETLVLNGDLSVLHMLGNLVEVNPYSVFGRVEGLILLEFSFRVFDIDKACLVELLSLEVDTRVLGGDPDNVNAEGYADYRSGYGHHHQECEQNSSESLEESFDSSGGVGNLSYRTREFADVCFTHRKNSLIISKVIFPPL